MKITPFLLLLIIGLELEREKALSVGPLLTNAGLVYTIDTTNVLAWTVDCPDDAPSLMTLSVGGKSTVEIGNITRATNGPSGVWIDPTFTNLVIRLYQEPTITRSNGVWTITFKVNP